MNLSDAHCHLQDVRFGGDLDEVLKKCRHAGIRRWMVNATREADWARVAALGVSEPGVRCSFGLHPWWQEERCPHWQESLRDILIRHPEAAIGEVGLDRWIPGHDLEDQRAVLAFHLQLSRELDRPVSLHCLRAWPELAACLKQHRPSRRGFLLHSCAAPSAMLPAFAEAGAYFSFSPAFLHPRKAKVREAFRQVPLDRLLIESDAPDMAPPAGLELEAVPGKEGLALNHPVNLMLSLRALAEDRGVEAAVLAERLEENAERLFGWKS